MKNRLDFVSNSSSSSFMVSNAKMALKILNNLGEWPYDIEGNFRLAFDYKNKDSELLKKEFFNKNHFNETCDCWIGSDITPETDMTCYIEYINSFITAYSKLNSKIKSKIYNLRIYCEEGHSSYTPILNMLFDLFDKNGLKPTDENTEINFRPDKNDNSQNGFLYNLTLALKN